MSPLQREKGPWFRSRFRTIYLKLVCRPRGFLRVLQVSFPSFFSLSAKSPRSKTIFLLMQPTSRQMGRNGGIATLDIRRPIFGLEKFDFCSSNGCKLALISNSIPHRLLGEKNQLVALKRLTSTRALQSSLLNTSCVIPKMKSRAPTDPACTA